MFGLSNLKSSVHKSDDTFAGTLEKIKNGNHDLRERFIDDYKPFILSCVSKYMNKYIEVENSEEFSIGLMAFNEAIDDYDKTKNQHFLSFSELVINRRLINYKKREKRNLNTYPFSYFEEGNGYNNLESTIVEDSVVLHFDRFEAREEIQAFRNKLNRFEITLDELIKKTPKHRDSKQLLIRIASIIADHDDLYKTLENKMYIPVTELMSYIKVSHKTIERNRKYIIAACLALRSDLDMIKEFLRNV